MNKNLHNFLNISRWFSAFLVVINHVRHLVMVGLGDVQHKTLLTKALYFVTGFGHEAVVVFFVLSGFLVGGTTMERWLAERPRLLPYATSRFSRIYTVLLPALFIGLLLDAAGARWLNSGGLYTHTVTVGNTVIDLLGNILMLQGILVNTFGTNGPLWSLAYEWWYYCVFALCAAAYTGEGRRRQVYGGLGVLLIIVLPVKIVLWGTIWLLGLLARYWVKQARHLPRPWVGMLIFFLVLLFSRLSHNPENGSAQEPMWREFGRDCVLGVAYILALVSIGGSRWSLPLERWNERLADFSYTTYLLHFPLMVFLVALADSVGGIGFARQPGAAAWLYALLLTVALYGACYVAYLLTERHTGVVKKKLDALLGVQGSGRTSAAGPALARRETK